MSFQSHNELRIKNFTFTLFKIAVYVDLQKNWGTVDPRFNGHCLLADNQPRSELKSVSVKESPVSGGRVSNIIR